MKIKTLFAIFLLATMAASAGWAAETAEKRECKWTYRISGERADGRGPWDKEMTVTERCYDFDAAGRDKQQRSDRTDYAGYDYRESGPPSQRQDCAGYTFEKLFGKGPYWIDAANFDEGVIFWFGKEIFRPGLHQATWGDVRPGDVVVYRQGGKAKHIAWVRNVETTAGVVTKIWIETKDATQGAFLHPIGFFEWPNDPLTVRLGDIFIYRVDPSKVHAQLASKTCDCPPIDSLTGKPKPTEEKKDAATAADPTENPKVDGKEPAPPDKREDWNGRWKGREKVTFVTELEGAPPQIREGEFEMQVIQDGLSVRLIGYGEKGKETALQLTPSNPNVAMMKREWTSAVADAVGLNKETLVVFLRDGRLYLSQRLLMTITAKKTVTHVTSDTIGIADRVK